MSFRSLRSITPRGLGLNHCSIKSGVLYNTKQQCVNISHNMFLISLGFSYPICFISRLTGESKPAGIEIVWQRTRGSMFEHLWNNTSKKPGWMMIFLWWCRKSIPTLIIPGCFSPWTLAPKRSIWFWRFRPFIVYLSWRLSVPMAVIWGYCQQNQCSTSGGLCTQQDNLVDNLSIQWG